MKAFGYFERVVKSDLFLEKTYFTSYLRMMFWATVLYKYYEVFSLIWALAPLIRKFAIVITNDVDQEV